MPPVGGIGANLGFLDSADLCDALSQVKDGVDEQMFGQVISKFEDAMLQRSKVAVERISSGAGHFFGMKPFAKLKPAEMWQ